jgi:hypothetical protein
VAVGAGVVAVGLGVVAVGAGVVAVGLGVVTAGVVVASPAQAASKGMTNSVKTNKPKITFLGITTLLINYVLLLY